MNIIEIESQTYKKENATVYERYLNSKLLCLKIVPDDGYIIRISDGAEEEPNYTYVDGWVTIAKNSIAELFELYDVIEKET